jgi:outer membrane protein assembly factor BamB
MKKLFAHVVWFSLLIISLIACGGGGGGDSGAGTASNRLLYSFSQGSTGFYYNPPTLVGNYIYIGTSRGFLYDVATTNYFLKLNLNLTKVWEYPLGNKEVRGGATLDSAGNIYFAMEDGRLSGNNSNSKLYLYSLDNNGVFRWSKQIASSVFNMGMSNPAIAGDDTIFIGGNKFYALDKSGNEKWTYGNNMTIMNAPILDPNGNIYFSASGSIISLDQNGGQRWSFATSGEAISSPAFSVDYSKVFVGVGNKVYCLQTSTGIKVWEFTPAGVAGTFRATPAVDNNNNVFIGTKADTNSVFYAIKSDGSGLLWNNAIGADLYSSPALGTDNTVYVGSEYSGGRRLHALDMTTGNTKWSASLGADATWSSPAITTTGTLFIASMDYLGAGGGLYAFRTDSTGLLPNAGSSRFHGGNSNTGRRE